MSDDDTEVDEDSNRRRKGTPIRYNGVRYPSKVTAETFEDQVLVTVHHVDGDQLACRLDDAEAKRLAADLLKAAEGRMPVDPAGQRLKTGRKDKTHACTVPGHEGEFTMRELAERLDAPLAKFEYHAHTKGVDEAVRRFSSDVST